MLDTAVDLSNCDREPIHVPGSVQAHGCLLACDSSLGTVRRHSVNAGQMLGLGSSEINGRTLDALIGATAAHDIGNAIAKWGNMTRAGLLLGVSVAHSPLIFNIAAHRHQGVNIIEFEPVDAADATPPLELARLLIGRIGQCSTLETLFATAPRLLRAALGYDRVMVYRFAEDGSGEVISEARRGDLVSFLGQHFPASDIPQQARVLYLQNTLRIVANANGERIAIEPVLDQSGEPLDLSYAHLRSVSSVHCEYLRNMGVGASMSISIVSDGRLWGLIACHHYEPRTLSMEKRVAAEMFGEFFSLQLQAVVQKRKLEASERAQRYLDRLLHSVSHHADAEDLLKSSIADFGELMSCDGVGLLFNKSWTSHGSAPPPGAVPGLMAFISSVAEGRVWATSALSERLPSADGYRAEVSGVLAVPLSQLPRDYLLFFRREVAQTVNWGGDPNKTYESGPLGDRLTPRKSFAIWKQEVERQSLPWLQGERDSAEAVRAALVEVVLRHNEVLADERHKADLRQKMLNEELNHRVKNILALIKSLVSHPVANGRSIADYVVSLKGRIQALSLAHDQVIRGAGGGALKALLDAELSPYRGTVAEIAVDGPDVQLDARAYSVLALVLHELATNAAKYGALSFHGGRLSLRWERTGQDDCHINWIERGGPAVAPPERTGFGSMLIGRSIPYDLGGQSDVDYAPDGVSVRLLIPARFVTWPDAAPVAVAPPRAVEDKPMASMRGLSVLMVEDQLLIAMDVQTMLANEGASNVETASSVKEALHSLSIIRPDVAILDVNLGNGSSLPVAHALKEQGIPFVFATGYGESSLIPPSLAEVPIVRKPYDIDGLIAALTSAMARARRP
ncbi:GAF domain-containing protein [Rhodopseudomonas sp. P2A-2r]|uniref:HWE histidine kinase domain-containing protein n=1 Tax=Rhodopseudomonas sp. P2A-2r TaxID=2991972 RepID=UPI0022341C5B|nr:HWE histidine kinase domain-containing protein [Rhodopseudomonas sp. P2A-2r]UZE52259.1 GAF domain-containing protein [Rhodopseudomonas sp. P2A-2r]